nr:SprT family zinc-dependent metalloprotease [uncultured Anaeromusa sp.]
MKQWMLENQTLPLRISRRAGCKHIRLRLLPDGTLSITLPWHCPTDRLRQVLENQQDWLSEQLAVRQVQQQTDCYLFQGSWYRLQETKQLPLNISIFLDAPFLKAAPASPESRNLHLRQWYYQEAQTCFNKLIQHWSVRLGVSVQRLSIREQRTRWGSCSSKKNVNLNWRLILAPLPIIEYVVVHELCHMYIPNHSRLFWEELQQQLPDGLARRKWLQLHGQGLLSQPPHR